MDIHNDTELLNILNAQIVYPMAEYLSKKIVEEVNKFIRDNSPISTRTLRRYTTYNISKRKNGYSATIFIDTDAMQSKEERVGAYGIFNKFMSLDLSTSYNGQTISWHLVRWLEETGTWQFAGARRTVEPIGNNPFKAIGMFKNVYAEMDRLVPTWIDTFAKANGVRIERR